MPALSVIVLLAHTVLPADATADEQFEQLVVRYMDEFPALSPVSSTALGDHRFDSQLDDVDDNARQRELNFCRKYLEQLRQIDPSDLARANQVDHALLEYKLKAALWQLEALKEWAWNPLTYTELCGSAIYNLMARDFAPLPKRLSHVADRLEQFPRLYRQIRATLIPEQVPKIHAETALNT